MAPAFIEANQAVGAEQATAPRALPKICVSKPAVAGGATASLGLDRPCAENRPVRGFASVARINMETRMPPVPPGRSPAMLATIFRATVGPARGRSTLKRAGYTSVASSTSRRPR